jgi:quinol monooxygenase YgiN
MVIVWGSAETPAGRTAEALELSLQHVRRSRAEPGCISHAVSVDGENRNRLNFFEEWEDIDALQRHFAVQESTVFVTRLTELCSEPPEMRVFDATPIR